MPIRTSEATWRGGVRDGDGEMALGSGSWRGGYSFRSRFRDDEPAQSNPEELIAAGHAGCFSLALANNLEAEGYDPDRVHTTADCHLEMLDDQGPTITRIELTTEAAVPEISESEFQDIAEDAKTNCPVSRALAGVDITVDASVDT
ncbi:OsmC family peroxiredoxin [Halobellus ordinarius]|uniref:OsmC family peroxiredoxin n=1 Tax=Halobellus ordinarius TaxID=3075120 RepID=UPI0028800013|nr:OsmC family peroxiredoxin [Halobellus sp. ZY16]